MADDKKPPKKGASDYPPFEQADQLPETAALLQKHLPEEEEASPTFNNGLTAQQNGYGHYGEGIEIIQEEIHRARTIQLRPFETERMSVTRTLSVRKTDDLVLVVVAVENDLNNILDRWELTVRGHLKGRTRQPQEGHP